MADNKLCILSETPGPESIKTFGSRLLTYKQVVFCFLTNLEKPRNEDKTKNQKAMRSYANSVVAEVLAHNKKMAEKIIEIITLILQKFIQNYT